MNIIGQLSIVEDWAIFIVCRGFIAVVLVLESRLIVIIKLACGTQFLGRLVEVLGYGFFNKQTHDPVRVGSKGFRVCCFVAQHRHEMLNNQKMVQCGNSVGVLVADCVAILMQSLG